MSRTEFFLRFYGQTDEGIDECIRLILEHHPEGEEVSREAAQATTTVGGLQYMVEGRAIEVSVGFPSPTSAHEVHACEECRDTYMKYAAPSEPEANFESRSPGDVALGL